MKLHLVPFLAAALALGTAAAPASAERRAEPASAGEIGFLPLTRDITLRRIVVPTVEPRPVLLFLHGFPETLHAWDGVSAALAGEFEIHAFDWPGYGLSSRPAAAGFAYGPRDYARVLRAYVEKAGIDRRNLIIYATDIGGLPALLAALEEPGLARTIIVGDFAPFDRPRLMHERLRALKSPATNAIVRAQLNASRDEILENAMRRGLSADEQFEIPVNFKADMAAGWNHGGSTSADAFARYYEQFTRDQDHLEANLARLRTPVKVIWGAKDIYIDKEMGAEFARRTGASFTLLPGVAHYPHLQDPQQTAAEIRAAAR